jgi:hypothetical protein
MADTNFSPIQCKTKGVKIIVGSITLSAAAAVTANSTDGILSVVKTGTGSYTVTLRDRYVSLQGLELALLAAGTAAFTVHATSQAVASATPTVVIKTCAIGTGAPADVGVACTIYFTLNLKNSTAT